MSAVQLSSSRRGAHEGMLAAGLQGEAAKAPRRLRIIVADDDRDQVVTLMTLLRDEGHDVRGLYRGNDVLRVLDEFEPNVLVIDIKLPGSSGFELAERIRERYGVRKPLLIAISGVYYKGPDKILSHIVGFDHHLTKPVAFDALLEILEPLAQAADERLKRRAADDTQQLVIRAAELVGREKLAEQLGVPEALLEQWIIGEAKMPERKLFVLAAVLVKVAEGK